MYSHISNAVLPYYYSVISCNCVFSLMLVDIDHVRISNHLELVYHVIPLVDFVGFKKISKHDS